jgi:hypothetical protein
MNRTALNSTFLLSGLLLCSNLAALEPKGGTKGGTAPLSKPATAIEVGLSSLSGQLFQMAYSEYDVLKTRESGTRFIPQQIMAYFLKDPSGKNIDIVATTRGVNHDLTQEQATQRCQAMIKWVRFHLGVGDKGVPFENGSKFGSSALYSFLVPADVDYNEFEHDWAHVLDEQTMIMGNVGYIGSGTGPAAMCREPLVQKVP